MNANAPTEPHIFERILCGVDGTPASLFAVRQATAPPGAEGSLLLLAVANLAQAAHAGHGRHATRPSSCRHEAEAALAEAQATRPCGGQARERRPGRGSAAARREHATLIAVGSHGRRRAAGLLLGTVAARMLRDATCSVLVARAARDPETWPQTVVAGVDGSPESAAAFTVARSLADAVRRQRLGLVASTKDQLDREAAQSDRAGARGARRAARWTSSWPRPRSADLDRRRKPRAARAEGARERERARRAPGALVRARRTSRAGVTRRRWTRCRV